MATDRDDILGFTPTAAIPGTLFNAVSARILDFYPASARKSERCAVAVLEVVEKFYEQLAALEGDEQ